MKTFTVRKVAPDQPAEFDRTQLIHKSKAITERLERDKPQESQEVNDLREPNGQQQFKSRTESNLDHEVLEVGDSQSPPRSPAKVQPFYSNPMLTPLNDRKHFIFKVYALLTVHLGVTMLTAGIVHSVPALRVGITNLTTVFFACLILCIVLMVGIYFCKSLLRKRPQNIIIASVFTTVVSYVVAYFCAQASGTVVLVSALMTVSLTASLTIYAWKTKRDFTTCSGMLVTLCIGLILFGVFASIFPSDILTLFFCLLGIFLFGIYIVVDTQLIAGGRFDEFTYDDYVIGALMLYIDIIGLFLYIMRILASKLGN